MIYVLSLFVAVFSFWPVRALAGPPRTINMGGAEMVFVASGEFTAGLTEEEPGSDLNPLRKVYLGAFYIDRYEVTNALYRSCVSSGSCGEPYLIADYPPTLHEDGKDWYRNKVMEDYPVVGISWHQARVFCRWGGKRLPSAAEWEKAARGTDGRRYPWGDEWDGTRANWDEGGRLDGYRKIAPVGKFTAGASPYGAMDMAGNVREWVDDLVLKGGSWYSYPVTLRAADPGHEALAERDDDMGFRCAVDGGTVEGR